jgi:hypothetical protein
LFQNVDSSGISAAATDRTALQSFQHDHAMYIHDKVSSQVQQ